MDLDQNVLKTIAAAWTEALGVAEVSAEDEFFASGGDSLLAIRMIEQVEKELGVTYPVENFFLDDSFGGLAETVTAQLQERA